jgi:hypothetical protein
VLDATVVIVAVTVTAAPLSCTEEFDKLHVGIGFADGVMLQLRFNVPVNVPAGATAIPNCAFCPAAIVCEACDPGANPRVKFGAATPLPESATFCVPPPLCVTVIIPVALPTAVGGTTFVARNFSLPEEGKCTPWSGYTKTSSIVILTTTGTACLSSDSTALTVSVSSNDPAWLSSLPPVNDYIQLSRADSTQPFRGEDSGQFGYPAESETVTCTSDLLNLPSSHL